MPGIAPKTTPKTTSEPRKRSIRISGHSTSLTLEEPFWRDLRDLAKKRGLSLNALVGQIDTGRGGNLSSALRLYIRDCYRSGELGPHG
jgi:predicted DNA-binding ribbon-helix-helix protein